MFQEVLPKTDFPALERAILEFWESRKIFEKSVSQREGEREYVFYDGPPFATGLPHYGHLLAGTIKDIVPRYWSMQGRKVDRRFGWDCHGLPVENEAAKNLKAEKNLDLSSKYEIERYGVDRFNEYCRSIVLTYTKDWEYVVKRMGRWVDFKNGYRTMDRDFMESIWWVFKQLWDRDLVYQGHRVMPFSWKLSTPLSNFEANLNYKDVQDPAVTIKFKLDHEEDSFFLAWTTTPWTLPSNLALAVGENLTYVKVRAADSSHHYILAETRVSYYADKLKTKLEPVATYLGKDLLGRSYQPLLPYFAHHREKGAFRVIAAKHVTTEDGTGIVHMAPAFGEEDFEACRHHGIPLVNPVDMAGCFTAEVPDFEGQMVKDADKHIIRRLKEDGSLLLHETLQHSYPYCWRSDTPLIYRAITTWFVKVSQLKDRMIANNAQVDWVPENVGSKRFGNWLENARDWNISRNRYWGTPIPVWSHEASGEKFVLGSVAELEQLTGKSFADIHSHFIDDQIIVKDGKAFRRIPEVFDCWFESGSMPYAQHHYPFENKALVERNFPADFIAEGLDQTRGWFYTLTVLATALFDKPAFKNVVVNGLILAEDGHKMSKTKKNYPDPLKVIEKYGADCLRSYLINSPVVRAEPLRFQETGILQIYRGVVLPFWNAYSFFVTYANLDDYRPGPTLTDSTHELDQWILSHFQTLVEKVTHHMERNHLFSVVPQLETFIDLLTNWYIRRSRRRFWRAESDTDKADAHNTLYYVLTEFSKVMAPFLPFLCESIYRNLVFAIRQDQPESVHLCDYPKPQAQLINRKIEQDMDLVRTVVELGRSLRAAHNLKTRQPLARLSIVLRPGWEEVFRRLGEIISEELNVKEIQFLHDETALISYSARPNLKRLGPRLGKALKQIRPAIQSLDHDAIGSLLKQGSIRVGDHEFSVEDFLIDRVEKQGMVVLSDRGLTIALDTQLTPDLLMEGDARELINRIQHLRKEAGFKVEERIYAAVEGDWVAPCLAKHGDYIRGETLTEAFKTHPFASEINREWHVNDKRVTIALARVHPPE